MPRLLIDVMDFLIGVRGPILPGVTGVIGRDVAGRDMADKVAWVLMLAFNPLSEKSTYITNPCQYWCRHAIFEPGA